MPAVLTPEQKDRQESAEPGYQVRLDMFEGPLDLLLHLIKKEEINIYDIPIARITDQYLEYLKLMEALDIAVAGDFLVMAATLIHIKSKMLLPVETVAEGEAQSLEDPRRELVEQLLEHQRFRSAAEMLHSRGEVEQAVFGRAPLESDDQNPEIAATVFDLFEVFQKILARVKERVEMEIARDEMTMAEKIAEVRQMLSEKDRFDVVELFERTRSRRELVLTFLAILELVRLAALRIVQETVYGSILAIRRDHAEVPAASVAPEAESQSS